MKSSSYINLVNYILLSILLLFVVLAIPLARRHSKNLREITFKTEIRGKIVDIYNGGNGNLYLKVKVSNGVYELEEGAALRDEIELLNGDSIYKAPNDLCFNYIRNKLVILRSCERTSFAEMP